MEHTPEDVYDEFLSYLPEEDLVRIGSTSKSILKALKRKEYTDCNKVIADWELVRYAYETGKTVAIVYRDLPGDLRLEEEEFNQRYDPQWGGEFKFNKMFADIYFPSTGIFKRVWRYDSTIGMREDTKETVEDEWIADDVTPEQATQSFFEDLFETGWVQAVPYQLTITSHEKDNIVEEDFLKKGYYLAFNEEPYTELYDWKKVDSDTYVGYTPYQIPFHVNKEVVEYILSRRSCGRVYKGEGPVYEEPDEDELAFLEKHML